MANKIVFRETMLMDLGKRETICLRSEFVTTEAGSRCICDRKLYLWPLVVVPKVAFPEIWIFYSIMNKEQNETNIIIRMK